MVEYKYKQVILIRSDVDMSRGKAVAQGAHASVWATQDADDAVVDEWNATGCVKITLSVPDKETLVHLTEQAEDASLPTATVNDAGHTEVKSGTLTAGAIGPARETEVDSITGNLSLYR